MLGKVKKVFAGGNTGYGFYSHYDQIISVNEQALYILKGGPGTGKCSFMRWIGQQMRERGYDIEEFYCSSDNNSLDGVRIPALGVALMDGTAPHVMDPRYPAAFDTIVHLGDYWDDAGIRENKDSVVALIRRNSFLFRRAYGYLRVAKEYNDQLQAYVGELGVLDTVGLNRVARETIDSIFEGVPVNGGPSRQRHLFASAITPQGLVNHLGSIVGELDRRVLVQGRPGTGRTSIVGKVAQAAIDRGYDVEIFHCALDPQRIDHVVIPDLSLAVVNSSEPHSYYAADPGDAIIDAEPFVDWAKLATYDHDILRLTRLYHEALNSAICLIGRAKKNHDQIEAHYAPHMNFAALGERRAEVLANILALAR
ncbi:MAG: PRK06851 family protein [Bacillota bacterium]